MGRASSQGCKGKGKTTHRNDKGKGDDRRDGSDRDAQGRDDRPRDGSSKNKGKNKGSASRSHKEGKDGTKGTNDGAKRVKKSVVK